jgi:hypothetical protein
MIWTQEEHAQFVTSLRIGDHNGVARAISDFVERCMVQAQAAAVSSRARPLMSLVTRPLNEDFVVDGERDALVFYPANYSTPLSVLGLGTSQVDVTLQVDGVAQAVQQLLLQATVVLGFSIAPTDGKTLPGFIPAGAVARLQTSSSGSNPGTATSLQGVEILL